MINTLKETLIAKKIYPLAQELFVKGDIDWADDDFEILLINAFECDVYDSKIKTLSDIPKKARISKSLTLEDRSVVDGAANASDVIFEDVEPYFIVTNFLIYKKADKEVDSILIATRKVGLSPIATNGGDIIINWGRGEHKIFRIPTDL